MPYTFNILTLLEVPYPALKKIATTIYLKRFLYCDQKLASFFAIYMVPRNSIQLLNMNTTKFQVEREPV